VADAAGEATLFKRIWEVSAPTEWLLVQRWCLHCWNWRYEFSIGDGSVPYEKHGAQGILRGTLVTGARCDMNRTLVFNMLATIDKLTEHKRSTG
jgi:hypothetical protein